MMEKADPLVRITTAARLEPGAASAYRTVPAFDNRDLGRPQPHPEQRVAATTRIQRSVA